MTNGPTLKKYCFLYVLNVNEKSLKQHQHQQSKFEILRNFQGKIGMNTMANKFYHISKLIGLDQLNLGFVHFKKLAKIQFLKNGNT